MNLTDFINQKVQEEYVGEMIKRKDGAEMIKCETAKLINGGLSVIFEGNGKYMVVNKRDEMPEKVIKR